MQSAFSRTSTSSDGNIIALGTVGIGGNRPPTIMMKSSHTSPPLPPSINANPKQVRSPRGLPPKSPSSITGKFLFHSTSRSAMPIRRRKRRGSKKNRREDNTAFGDISDDSSSHSGTSTTSTSSWNRQLHSAQTADQSLLDPSPDHLNVAGDADDFCSTADLNMVSLPSPTSVVDSNPLENVANAPSQNTRLNHQRSKSWDASDGTYADKNSKTCLQVPSIFRRQKVRCADVASVGNASDTLITVEQTGGRVSGRDLHEKAKSVLNAGDFSKALMMFEALQCAQTERFGEWHSSVGAATHNVGVVRLRMGQPKQAAEILQRAVAIRRQVLGMDHLDLASSLAKLGSARVVLQQFDDGLQVLREALRIARKTLGRSHKTVAQILCHIACLYFEAGELFSAQATFEDALDIYRDVFPSESDRDACMTQMTETLCNIGSIQNKRKNFTGAIDCFREALDLQRGIMGHDHPRVIASLDNLGYSFSKAKSYNQALICYKEMLTAQLSRCASFSIECCETLKKQTLIYEKQKDLDGAIKVTKKALEQVQKDTPIPEDSVTYEVEQMLAELKKKRREKRTGEF